MNTVPTVLELFRAKNEHAKDRTEYDAAGKDRRNIITPLVTEPLEYT